MADLTHNSAMIRIFAFATLGCVALFAASPLLEGPRAQPGGFIEPPDGGASMGYTEAPDGGLMEPSDGGFAEAADGGPTEPSDGGIIVGTKRSVPIAVKRKGPPDFEPVVEEILKDPTKAQLIAPPKYKVRLETTKGEIVIQVFRSWAPRGADRLYNLVRGGYYDNGAFFRVIEGFMAQTGIHGNPEINRVWDNAPIQDDPVVESNLKGTVSFATAGENTRTTQFFINAVNNTNLDGLGFAPVGRVDPASMKVVSALYAGYGDAKPRGNGPVQDRIALNGNAYLKENFERLDYINRAVVLVQSKEAEKAKKAKSQVVYEGYGQFKWGTSLKSVKRTFRKMDVDEEAKEANFEAMAYQVRYEDGVAQARKKGRLAVRAFDRKWSPKRRVMAYVYWMDIFGIRSRISLRFLDDGLYEVVIRVLYEVKDGTSAESLVTLMVDKYGEPLEDTATDVATVQRNRLEWDLKEGAVTMLRRRATEKEAGFIRLHYFSEKRMEKAEKYLESLRLETVSLLKAKAERDKGKIELTPEEIARRKLMKYL